jgi:hypothetical protein
MASGAVAIPTPTLEVAAPVAQPETIPQPIVVPTQEPVQEEAPAATTPSDDAK